MFKDHGGYPFDERNRFGKPCWEHICKLSREEAKFFIESSIERAKEAGLSFPEEHVHQDRPTILMNKNYRVIKVEDGFDRVLAVYLHDYTYWLIAGSRKEFMQQWDYRRASTNESKQPHEAVPYYPY